MPLFTPAERRFAEGVARLTCTNPFLPERIDAERAALGPDFVAGAGPVWSAAPGDERVSPNVERLSRRVAELADRARDRLAHATTASDSAAAPAAGAPADAELALYEDLVLYLLYDRHAAHRFPAVLADEERTGRPPRLPFYDEFVRDARRLLEPPGRRLAAAADLPHIFACFFQIRRAFHHIFAHLVGGSMPAARLRAAAWQSIFTHDMRRYRRTLFSRMGEFATLVVGPSGTGKELVARAIGLSRYIPFDARAQVFSEGAAGSFHALNLSALTPTLIESELFGHARGAFTGARTDRKGWLEICRPLGAVFLDEIGETEASLQVKLLRALQTRIFTRIGETAPRRFHGKLIAATNRDLAGEMAAGRFRPDFYYRLCSDMITTPSLREQLAEAPGELDLFLRFIARGLVGDEADALAAEVKEWIAARLGPDYAWPGTVRELEQCVRNVLIRREYLPPVRHPSADPGAALHGALDAGTLTAEALLRAYVTRVYAQTGSYEETARRLALDRRTVKAKVDPGLLAEFRRRPTTP
ncbi:MAG: sigma 54-interacting transcriptional regulator [Planctomycetes bacterium]|nr:sigma 54-interacting transcriptional regulator [Planctomycetota bacterium]